MSERDRQKLLNWFCTMLLLLLVCTLSFAISWRMIMVYAGIFGGDWALEKYAGPLGEAFRPYFLFFPLLAVWHFFDLLERDRKSPSWRGWFARYCSFFILLIVASPFAVLSAFDGHALVSCGDAFGLDQSTGFFDSCRQQSLSTFLLYFLFAPLVLLACVSKAISAILSYRRPTPQT